MFERQANQTLRRRPTPMAAVHTAPAWEATPAPPAEGTTDTPAAAAFDFGSLAIFPPEPRIGPEGGELAPATADRIRGKRGGGAPLDPPVQRRMGNALGHNFADVRIHADGEADTLSRGVGAHAFTLGRDIFLSQQAAGGGMHGGDALLAHELTHVVQQRGSVQSGALAVDPADAPAEREASAVARDVGAGHSAGGLRAASAAPASIAPMRAQSAIQREVAAPPASAPAATPADIAAQSAFNPMDINHKLLRAIDQSDVKMAGRNEWGGYIWKRHVDFAEAVAALSNLTAEQVKKVDEAYSAHENRSLATDLFAGGESGYPTDLTEDQNAQLRALLGGTQAGAGGTAEQQNAEQQNAKANATMAKAAELHRLLHGDLEQEDIERVMGLLRQDAQANNALLAAYGQRGGDLRGEVFAMGVLAGQRAWKLLAGDIVGADALKVGFDRARIQGIDERIAKLRDEIKENSSSIGGGYAAMSAHFEIEKLQKERKEVAGDIEQRAEQAGAEARAGAKGSEKETQAAVQARVGAVLGDVKATASLVAGADGVGQAAAAVIRAIAGDDPVAKVAAQLRKASQDDKLDAAQLTAALRGLRTEAKERAERQFPKGDPRAEGEEKRLADDYFGRLHDTYNDLVGPGEGKLFYALLYDTGDEGDVAVNKALVEGHGKLDDVTELELALRGDRKDMAAVQNVLRDKSAKEIEHLSDDYFKRTNKKLDFELFGDAATHAGGETLKIAGQEINPETGQLITQGKASGTDRLNLEDYMQRPDAEGGPAEVGYILARAEREYQYTIDNRGGTGWWRDHWGNEERDLLDETIKAVRQMHADYCALVGWVPAMDPKGVLLAHPEMVHDGAATQKIAEMRLARATIRGDRAAYEKATAELRAVFEMVAALVIQAALTALLTPAAGALLEVVELGEAAVEAGAMTARIATFASEVSVNVVATVGSNFAVRGSDYSLAMLKEDLLGGLGGSLGSAAVGKLLGPVAKGLAERLGPKCSPEILAFAKAVGHETMGLATTAGNIEGAALIQGQEGDLTLENVIKTHIIGKASGAVTEGTRKIAGLPPGHQTVVTHGEAPSPEPTAPAPRPEPTPTSAPTPVSKPTLEPAASGGVPVAPRGAEPVRSLSGETAAPVTAAKPVSPPEPGPASGASETATPETVGKRSSPRRRAPGGDDEITQVDWSPNDEAHRFPERAIKQVKSLAEGEALIEQMSKEDDSRDVHLYHNEKTGEVFVGWGSPGREINTKAQMHALPGEPGEWKVAGVHVGVIPEGAAMQGRGPAETIEDYHQATEEDPYREASLEVNRKTDDIWVAQGNEDEVGFDPEVAKAVRTGDPKDWWSPEHYHPADRATGETPEYKRFPSSSRGDLTNLVAESRNAGNQPLTTRIRHRVNRNEQFVYEYTEITYDPSKERPFELRYHDPETGAWAEPETFKSPEGYEAWFSKRFEKIGAHADIDAPLIDPGESGTKFSPRAPGEGAGSSGTPEAAPPSQMAAPSGPSGPPAPGGMRTETLGAATNPQAREELRGPDADIEAYNADTEAWSAGIEQNAVSDTYFEMPGQNPRTGEGLQQLGPGPQGYRVDTAPGQITYHINAYYTGAGEIRVADAGHVPLPGRPTGMRVGSTGRPDTPYEGPGAMPGYNPNAEGSVIPQGVGRIAQPVPETIITDATGQPVGTSRNLEHRYHSEDPNAPGGASGMRPPHPTEGPAYAAFNPTAPINTPAVSNPTTPEQRRFGWAGNRDLEVSGQTGFYLTPDGRWVPFGGATREGDIRAIHFPVGGRSGPAPPVYESPGPTNDGPGGGPGGGGPAGPGGGARGPGESLFTPEDIDAAVEGLRPVRQGGTAESDTMTRGPADAVTEQTMEAVRALSQLNDEVRALVQGRGLAPMPEGEDFERSEMEVEIAQRILQDPNATPENQVRAARALAERVIAEYRARHTVYSEERQFELDADDLRGACGMGRDITAEDLIALVGNSPHTVMIERMQAAHLGFGARHAFTIVTLAGGRKFLIDPTFAQFADQIGGRTFTAEPMLSSVEGGTLARDLLRDGVVPLTGDTARQYVIGLGADPATANEAAAELMFGHPAVLTEIVRNGQVQRITGRPNEALNIMTVSDPETTSPLRSLEGAIARLPANDPRRPILASLMMQLQGLATYLPPIPPPPPGLDPLPPQRRR